MAHVELSLSEAFVPPTAPLLDQESDSFVFWSSAVSLAAEPCLLIDVTTIIVAVSPSCCTLLGLPGPAEVVNRPLLDGQLRLLDFTAARGALSEQEVDKIPPLLALSSARLARGLLRVCGGKAGGSDTTVDAIATPLSRDGVLAGSLTFFALV